MEKTKDEARALLMRHLLADWSPEEELALFALQSEAKQSVVEKRLKVIDHYLDPSSSGAGDVDLATAALGIGRRQFFNLIAKVRQLGPTRGLAPGFRNVVRHAIAREGLDVRLDCRLRDLLAQNPGAKLAALEAALREMCEDESELSFPGRSAIRRRVLALRSELPVREDIGPFGSQLIIDQVNLDLTINEEHENRFAIITLIVDQQTKLIAGHSVTARYFPEGEGLRLAYSDLRERIWRWNKVRLSVADRVDELIWIVPPRAEYTSHIVQSGDRESDQPSVRVVETGSRRHGSAILRAIGDRLPPFSFKPMAMERREGGSSHPGIPLEEARSLVAMSVERWNEAIIAKFVEEPDQKRRRSLKLSRLESYLGELLFDPVLAAISEAQTMFEDADFD